MKDRVHTNPIRIRRLEIRTWDGQEPPARSVRWWSLKLRRRPYSYVLKRTRAGRQTIYVLWVNR